MALLGGEENDLDGGGGGWVAVVARVVAPSVGRRRKEAYDDDDGVRTDRRGARDDGPSTPVPRSYDPALAPPETGWRRVLALWGYAGTPPFFAPFRGRT